MYILGNLNNNNNNNDLLEKDGGTKNCIYKDLLSGIQGLVSSYRLLLNQFTI